MRARGPLGGNLAFGGVNGVAFFDIRLTQIILDI